MFFNAILSWLGPIELTHWDRDKMAAIFQTTFSNSFYQLNDNVWISTKTSLKFVHKYPNNDNPAVVQIMAWRRLGDNHCLNQWWLDYRRIYASLGLNELNSVDLWRLRPLEYRSLEN